LRSKPKYPPSADGIEFPDRRTNNAISTAASTPKMTLRFTLELYHRVVWKLGSLVDCLPLKHAVRAAVPSGSPKRKQVYCDFGPDFLGLGMPEKKVSPPRRLSKLKPCSPFPLWRT